MTDEHFIVWMRPSGLPNFRKLWGRIHQDLEPGEYTLNINNQFDVASFSGQKHFVLSNVNAFGGKNTFLAVSYIVVGVICIILAIVFWFLDNYFLSLLSCLFQSLCFILFGLSFIPGGQSGISFIKKKISSPFVKIFMNVAKKEITNS